VIIASWGGKNNLAVIIACTSPVDWAFAVLELATNLIYNTTYVEMYHCYIFVQACY
jgi:hypothetical protein